MAEHVRTDPVTEPRTDTRLFDPTLADVLPGARTTSPGREDEIVRLTTACREFALEVALECIGDGGQERYLAHAARALRVHHPRGLSAF